MQLRRFKPLGEQAFAEFLAALRVDGLTEVPVDLLHEPRLTEPLPESIEAVPPTTFANRMAFARWLHDAAEASRASVPRNDAGFWAWLSLALFDHVCPADANGRRKPHANERYILAKSWTRSYRHLLQNPYDVFYLHRDEPARALVALVNPLNSPGELTENISGRREIVGCSGCMSLASYLCVDPDGKRRPGASGDFANIFGRVIRRLSRTWDIPVMPPETSAKLLQQKKLRKLVDAATRP